MERALSNVPPRGMELWFMQPWAAAADGRAALEPMLSRNYRAFNSPVRPGRGAQSSHLGTVPPQARDLLHLAAAKWPQRTWHGPQDSFFFLISRIQYIG